MLLEPMIWESIGGAHYRGFIISNEGREIRTSYRELEESDPCQILDGFVARLPLCLLLAAGERRAAI